MNFAFARTTKPSHGRIALSERLDAARMAVEGRFLEAGEVLGKAVDGLARLFETLERLGRSLDGETVSITTSELLATAADLLAMPAQHASRAQAIEDLLNTSQRLAVSITEMRRNLAYLRIFAIDIKITAGSMASAGDEFGSFAQDICECIDAGGLNLTAFDRQLQALIAILHTAKTQQQDAATKCEGLLGTVPDGLESSAAAILTHHQQISKIAVDVSILAKSIQKKVGAALAALQIGDITRQRVEHVGEALVLLAKVSHLSADEYDTLAGFIYGLLAAQLQSAGDDFHRSVAHMDVALNGIAQDASELLRLRESAFGRSHGDGAGVLRKLESHVGKALTLVDGMGGADRKALEVGAAAVAAAQQLKTQIAELRAIKTDVQVMALNTALKCSRAGDAGKPLAIIAVELRTYAGHLETSAKEATASLEGLSTEAGLLGGAAAEGAGGGLSNAFRRLHSAGDAVEADLAALASEGGAVVNDLRHAAGRLDFQLEIGSILDEAAQALWESAGDEDASLDAVATPLGELLALMLKSYTMGSERDVQRDYIDALGFKALAIDGAATINKAAESAPVAAEFDLDDVLF